MTNQYRKMLSRSNCMYMFVNLYNTYINEAKNYGTAYNVTMTEAHMLSYIEENPGITSSDLARHWHRTKGAISQIITKLENKGLLERTKDEEDSKKTRLYPTVDGIKLSLAHKSYDVLEVAQTMDELLKSYSEDEIETFFKVMESYNQMLYMPEDS